MTTAFRMVAYSLIGLMVVSHAGATTKGRVDEGQYYSPLDNFSMPLRNAMGLRIQDDNDADGGRVSFPDDWGYLEAVTYLRIPAEATAALNDPEQRAAIYRSFINDYAMQTLFLQASPQSAVVRDEFIDASGSKAYFAIVNIPGASAMIDPQQKKKKKQRLDSVRALLVFDKNGFMYMLESEMNYSISQASASSLSTSQVERAQETLRKLRESMTFN